MRRIIWLSLTVCLVTLVLVCTAVVYGRTLPPPPAPRFEAAGFDVCGGKWCLFHITPGFTTWVDAKRTLAQNITRDEGDHFHGQVGPAAIRVQMGYTDAQIGAVEVRGTASAENPLSLRFGQIIEQFGSPCSVGPAYSGSDSLTLAYPSFSIEVLAVEGGLSFKSPVSAITVSSNSNLDIKNRSCSDKSGFLPWRGFGSMQVYKDLQQAERQYPYP